MESHPSVTDRPVRIPPIVWFLGLGLIVIVALTAIVVSNVSVSTVTYYGFIAFIVGSHLFMHGSHGGQGGHAGHQPGTASNTAAADKKEHTRSTGGCH